MRPVASSTLYCVVPVYGLMAKCPVAGGRQASWWRKRKKERKRCVQTRERGCAAVRASAGGEPAAIPRGVRPLRLECKCNAHAACRVQARAHITCRRSPSLSRPSSRHRSVMVLGELMLLLMRSARDSAGSNSCATAAEYLSTPARGHGVKAAGGATAHRSNQRDSDAPPHPTHPTHPPTTPAHPGPPHTSHGYGGVDKYTLAAVKLWRQLPGHVVLA